ncbi:MAG: YihY/virulence factor BrkB family protein [Thermosynechococcaceae cyanobacterium]
MTVKQIGRLLIATFKEWNEDQAPRMAAALAYYTVFSLAPLLLLVVAIAGIFLGPEAAQGQIVSQFQGLLGKEGAEAIQSAIENASQSGSGLLASVISIVTLLLGACGVFTQLQSALNTAWEVKAKPKLGIWGFIRSRFLSFSMILVIAFLLMVSLVVSAGLAALSQFTGTLPGADFLWQILNVAIALGILTLLFAMIFKVLPDAKIAWNDVWVGAFITALLFSVGKQALGVYIGNGSMGSAYGAASFLLILLVWIYYSAQILFFGA